MRQVRIAKTTSSGRLSVYFQRICSERKYFHKSLRLTRLKSSIAKSVEKINCTSEDYALQRVKNFHFLFTQRIILLLDNMQPVIVSNDGPTMSEMSVFIFGRNSWLIYISSCGILNFLWDKPLLIYLGLIRTKSSCSLRLFILISATTTTKGSIISLILCF